MKAIFNVLDQRWIPVIDRNGKRDMLGLRKLLEESHELREISDPSPLAEYSLYRFIGLFLMDAFKPEEEVDIEELLEKGRFDTEIIEQYISTCVSEGVSFDLFDEKRPFLQSRFDPKDINQLKPVSYLDNSIPSGNTHTLFDHNPKQTMEAKEAAKYLLTSYWFCTAAAQGYPSGVYGAPPFFGVIKGNTLFETLVALLVPKDRISLPFDNPPVFWRRVKPVIAKEERATTSWLEGMLFPTRRIQLVPDSNGNVIQLYYGQGENFKNTELWRDPYVTYLSNEDGFYPMRPHSDNPIWRNYCDIIDIPGAHASVLLKLYKDLHPNNNVDLTLYGVETDQASFLSVLRYDLSFSLSLVEKGYIDLMVSCVSASQNLRKVFLRAIKDAEVVPGSTGAVFVNRFDDSCAECFWSMCHGLGAGEQTNQEHYDWFCNEIALHLLREYDSLVASLNLRGRALAKCAEIRSWMYYDINKLRKEAAKR